MRYWLLVCALWLSAVSPLRADPLRAATLGTIAGGATLGFVEIVASEACIQRGSCYEANRFMPDGRQKAATIGRAFIKGAGTSAAVYFLLKARDATNAKARWVALIGAGSLLAWNGYLAKRALDRFPAEGVR